MVADIRPFRGVRYDTKVVGSLAEVICPPYDVIPPSMQDELYRRNQYNFVRIEFTKETSPHKASDKYSCAAQTLNEWLKQAILITENKAAFYLHDHSFTLHGKEYQRRGIIARVRLEEWEKRIIRPHEGTLAEPKSDRLTLLRTLQANTSPIFVLYEDRNKHVTSLLNAQERTEPVIDFTTNEGERHIIRTITENDATTQLAQIFAEKPLYIADGHHRYESALAYRREMLSSHPMASADEGFNFVMMTLVDFADPGLVILPPHRLARGISQSALDALETRLTGFFRAHKMPANSPDTPGQVQDFLDTSQGQVRLALFVREHFFLLTLRNARAADSLMPTGRSELYRRLGVSIVDHVILENLLGITREAEKTLLGYSHDTSDAIKRVLAGEYQLALLLSPVTAMTIKAIADAGDRMPRKSTYFYPKLPSGLVIHKLT